MLTALAFSKPELSEMTAHTNVSHRSLFAALLLLQVHSFPEGDELESIWHERLERFRYTAGVSNNQYSHLCMCPAWGCQ